MKLNATTWSFQNNSAHYSQMSEEYINQFHNKLMIKMLR